MKRLPALTVLLMVTFLLVACGGSGQSGQAPEPEEGNTEPATERSVPADTTRESTAPDSATPEREQDGQGDEPGYSVTTLDGEQVNLGGGGDATALFFMAGW